MIIEFAQTAQAEEQFMSIDELAVAIKEQADRLFPDRTDSSMFLKMFQEIGELVESGDPDEVADVLIMLLDFAKRKRIPIAQIVLRKMAVNDQRTWAVNELGVMHHV